MGNEISLEGMLRLGFRLRVGGRRSHRIDITVGPAEDYPEPLPRGEKMAVIVKLKEGQKVPLTLAVHDDRGKPARIDGKPEWKLEDGADRGVKVVADDDGMKATLFAPVGSAGTARIVITSDADLGEGVRAITSEADFVISARDATSVDIIPGEPVDFEDGEAPALKANGTGKKKKS